MTVLEFELKLEAIYGVEVDIDVQHTISGFKDANSTLTAIYIISISFGSILFPFAVIIIALNELKYRRLHYISYLTKTEFEVLQRGKTNPKNHNKLIFTKGYLTIEKEGGIYKSAKDDQL
jgi:hypothetical protein